VTLALGVPGSGTQLLVNDDAGLSVELRQAIAEVVGLEPARVSITAVQTQELAPNGTLVSSGAAIALNATTAANNGTLAQSNASLVWATPTAQPVIAPAALRRVLQAADAACVAYRSFNVSNGTRTSVSLALDMSGLAWVNNTDPAERIAALLARALGAPSALLNFTHAWTECTGVNAAAAGVQVLQAPAVRTGTRPSPSQLAAAASAAGGGAQQEYSGLGKGGLTAVLVALLFSACACCCFVGALCGGARRRRKQQEAEEREAADKGERDVEAATSSPSDLAVAAIRDAVCHPRAAAAAAPAVSSV
jgi:hypothetical protein